MIVRAAAVLMVALVALIAAGCSDTRLTVTEYATLTCGEGLEPEVEEAMSWEGGETPTNGQVTDWLEAMTDIYREVRPPRELDELHRREKGVIEGVAVRFRAKPQAELATAESLLSIVSEISDAQVEIFNDLNPRLREELIMAGCQLPDRVVRPEAEQS